MSQKFPKLSSSFDELENFYDVIIVGSGYGASIAASRCARAGQVVCVLEKGKEWLPGSFPETSTTAFENMQISRNGCPNVIGKSNGLYDIVISKDITVVKGCGLGGTSLINANVVLDADENVFRSKQWPKEIQDDMKDLKEVDRKRVFKMLQPTTYPEEYPALKKVGAMERAARSFFPDIEELGMHFRKTPLAVNFESEKTEDRKYRFDQPACNGCGNCCGGCNTGAKQTLNMNYLPDAKCYGAKIFTEVEVSSVLRDEHGYVWKVKCHLNVDSKGLKPKEMTLRAHNVILGAGSLGSTQILLKSKTDGLEISNTIGSRFTGNGDALGFCYDSKMDMNAIGSATGKFDSVKNTSPGPCITTVIDFRNNKRKLDNNKGKTDTEKNGDIRCNAKRERVTNDNTDDRFKGEIIIEDGTPPGSLSKLLKVALYVDSRNNCKHDFHEPEEFEKIFQTLLASDELDKTLPFLCMGHDDSSGEIRIGDNGDGVYIDWENVGRQQVFECMDLKMRAITKELGGTFIQNPSWSDMMDKKLVTVHPLGGCPMGNNGQEGVVNHKGEVFIGDSDSVYQGLYVMDGSIIPSPVGVNPLLTISMLAERCCRLMCEKNNWKVDYDEVKDFNNMEFPQYKPGLRFTEKMSGSLKVKGTSKDLDCQFVVTITADDVEKFLNDDNHEASVAGTVECPLLSNDAVTISEGTFNLFRENGTKSEEEVLMEYNFHLTTTEGISYRFKGVKRRVKGGIGLHDSTTLYTELYEGDSGMLIAEGILKIHLKDFMKQLRTIKIINTGSEMLKIKWTSEFGKYFFGKLWFSHGHCIASMHEDSPEAGRMKRELDIKNVTPQIFSFDTEDQVPLMLTRYQGGTKGPLIACHGLGTNSSLFNLTTVEKNFVEYFVSNDYDVWLLDSRQSTFCPWASESDKYSLDDLAKFDFPAAVDVVLKHTKMEKLQMFVHCAGALPFWGSLLSGKLNGKIASIIVSQVTPITKGSMGNRWKSWLGFTETASNFGISLVDPNSEILIYKSTFEWMKSFLPFWMLSLPSSIAGKIAQHLFPRNDNICTNGVCHRLGELYGRLYEHQNLTRETHDTLYELFGIGALGHFNQLCKCFRAGKLVDRKGNDTYLPGLDKHGKLDKNARSKDWVKNVDVPILMFCGEKNRVFRPEGMQTMERVLKELHPKQDYRFISLEEYGHIDGIIGKYAVSDLWPELLSFLDMHSQSARANDERLAKIVAQTMHQLELIGSTAELSEELRAAICHDTTDFGFKGAKVDKDNDEQVPFYEERLKGVLPNQDEYVWERKVKIHTRFEQHREYKANEEVKTYSISDDSKRTIYVLSDIHMGSSWTKDSVSELRQFEAYLKGIALSTAHSVVLLGDVFDLWATPIDQRPFSLDEMKQQWMEKPTFLQVLTNFKTMAEKANVKIFYVKGNHDNEITEQVVKELLGDDVIFIPDKLILRIKSDDQPYYMRFEHGHAYDIFNTYELTNDTLKGKPIGYYVSRFAQSSDAVDSPGLLRKILYKFLSSSIGKKLGSEVVDLLARWPSLQHCLLKTIFKEALGKKSIAEDTGVVMEDGSKVLINDIIKYPIFTEAKKKYGSSEAFLMLLAAAAGNYEEFLAKMPEDVIVFAHTHEFKNQKSLSKTNVFHYANSGSWTDIAECKSYICLNLPTKEQNGLVSCRFACSVDEACCGACSDGCVCPCNCSH